MSCRSIIERKVGKIFFVLKSFEEAKYSEIQDETVSTNTKCLKWDNGTDPERSISPRKILREQYDSLFETWSSTFRELVYNDVHRKTRAVFETYIFIRRFWSFERIKNASPNLLILNKSTMNSFADHFKMIFHVKSKKRV